MFTLHSYTLAQTWAIHSPQAIFSPVIILPEVNYIVKVNEKVFVIHLSHNSTVLVLF